MAVVAGILVLRPTPTAAAALGGLQGLVLLVLAHVLATSDRTILLVCGCCM